MIKSLNQFYFRIKALIDLNYSPGHFYSPIIDKKAILKKRDIIWPMLMPTQIHGIELRVQQQLELYNELIPFLHNVNFSAEAQDDKRFYLSNDMFSHGDAYILYAMLCFMRPNQILEIGSGFSSALMMDFKDEIGSSELKITCIEPFTDRLNSLLRRTEENLDILEEEVQNLPISIFSELEEGDLLFIDSSHVCKTGSDLNHLLFNIIPSLSSGVLVHFHDIFYPFEYPEKWIIQGGRSWNEAYLLRAFLINNSKIEIVLWNNYLQKCHSDLLRKNTTMIMINQMGSIWLRIK